MERVITKLPHRTRIPCRSVRFAPIVKGERPVHDLDMEAEWTTGGIFRSRREGRDRGGRTADTACTRPRQSSTVQRHRLHPPSPGRG